MLTHLAALVALAFPVDLSALSPERSAWPVDRAGARLCLGHADGDVLAVAIVTYGRRPGRSAWGHTSLRFLACEDQQLIDEEYEYYRMDGSISRWFRSQYPGEAWTEDDAYLSAQYGKLVLVRNSRPVDGGFYGVELEKNREIIEAWMPWSPEIRSALWADLRARHDAQIETFRRGEVFEMLRYEPMGTNCTLHVREALRRAEGWDGTVYPIANLRRIKERTDVLFVVYPSPYVLRRLTTQAGVAGDIDHLPRPLLRLPLGEAQEQVVESALVDARSVVVDELWRTQDAPPNHDGAPAPVP